jgi:hypothetical protein
LAGKREASRRRGGKGDDESLTTNIVEEGRTQHHGWSCPEPRKCYMGAPHGGPTRISLRRKITQSEAKLALLVFTQTHKPYSQEPFCCQYPAVSSHLLTLFRT